jgi:hypothetical protein
MTRKTAVRPASAGGFSDQDEAFFRDGLALEAELLKGQEDWGDLDEGYEPTSLWGRLRDRRPPRAATEPPLTLVPPFIPAAASPAPGASRSSTPAIVTDEDEEWQWQLAIARARVAND